MCVELVILWIFLLHFIQRANPWVLKKMCVLKWGKGHAGVTCFKSSSYTSTCCWFMHCYVLFGLQVTEICFLHCMRSLYIDFGLHGFTNWIQVSDQQPGGIATGTWLLKMGLLDLTSLQKNKQTCLPIMWTFLLHRFSWWYITNTSA